MKLISAAFLVLMQMPKVAARIRPMVTRRLGSRRNLLCRGGSNKDFFEASNHHVVPASMSTSTSVVADLTSQAAKLASLPADGTGHGCRDAPMLWTELKDMIEHSERDQFGRPTATAIMGRSPPVNAKYREFRIELARNWVSTLDYLMYRVFDWPFVFEDAPPTKLGTGGAGPEGAANALDSSQDRAAPAAADSVVLGTAEVTSTTTSTSSLPLRRRIAVRPSKERDHLMANVFSAGQPPPLRVARRLVWRPNDFPYWFEDGVTHDVLWASAPPALSVDEIEAAIAERANFENADSCEVLWWANPPSLKSVPDLDHVHVVTRRKPKSTQAITSNTDADASALADSTKGNTTPRARL